jgi:hypothetical protein
MAGCARSRRRKVPNRSSSGSEMDVDGYIRR